MEKQTEKRTIGKYVAVLTLSKHHELPWEEIKNRLTYQVMETIIPPMIGSGMYHVIKLDIAKEEEYDTIRYYMISKLSVAREQTIVFQKMEPLSVNWQGRELRRVCVYCGNALTLDWRGGCVACGAPNGGYKN